MDSLSRTLGATSKESAEFYEKVKAVKKSSEAVSSTLAAIRNVGDQMKSEFDEEEIGDQMKSEFDEEEIDFLKETCVSLKKRIGSLAE